MLQFTNQFFLWLLPLVPIVFFGSLRRRRAALRFADTRYLAGLPHRRPRRIEIIEAGLRAIAIFSVITALSGPRLPDLRTRLPTESIAIMLVLDVSGSMETESFLWQEGSPRISRREAAKRAFQLFVAGGNAPDGTQFPGRSTERGTDEIGLVTFTNWPQPVCPPTLNHSVLLHILNDSRPASIREEGSNIGDGIAQGLILLEQVTTHRKVLILFSDGELQYTDPIDPDRKPMKPRQAAQLAANLGIPIYVIDTGGDLPSSASLEDLRQREDGRQMNEAVAALTGGRSLTANNGLELLEVCRTIDSLERQPILSNVFRRYFELYSWFAGAALGILTFLMIMGQTRWRKLP